MSPIELMPWVCKSPNLKLDPQKEHKGLLQSLMIIYRMTRSFHTKTRLSPQSHCSLTHLQRDACMQLTQMDISDHSWKLGWSSSISHIFNHFQEAHRNVPALVAGERLRYRNQILSFIFFVGLVGLCLTQISAFQSRTSLLLQRNYTSVEFSTDLTRGMFGFTLWVWKTLILFTSRMGLLLLREQLKYSWCLNFKQIYRKPPNVSCYLRIKEDFAVLGQEIFDTLIWCPCNPLTFFDIYQ